MKGLPYCEKCGAQLVDDARFCHSCGYSANREVKEEVQVSSEDLIKKVKDLIREGNVRRIVVKDGEGRALLEIPVTAGVIGALLAPWLAALGVIAAMYTRCTISVEKKES